MAHTIFGGPVIQGTRLIGTLPEQLVHYLSQNDLANIQTVIVPSKEQAVRLGLRSDVVAWRRALRKRLTGPV